MRYKILDEEVQKTYYLARELLDSQGFSEQLNLYIAIGMKNQPKEWRDMGFGHSLKPVIILLFVVGIILIFTKHILFGVGFILVGILISSFFGRKIERSRQNLPAIESATQKIGSHRLMKIVADEMSKGSPMEEIAEALKREIRETLKSK